MIIRVYHLTVAFEDKDDATIEQSDIEEVITEALGEVAVTPVLSLVLTSSRHVDHPDPDARFEKQRDDWVDRAEEEVRVARH